MIDAAGFKDIAEMTAGELWELRVALEAQAASLLGHMLFEFSRIETNLGLCLVWVDAGATLEQLTPKVAKLSFHAKLEQLAKDVAARLPAGSKRRRAYDDWIVHTDRMRQVRNQLVHGRWGVEPRERSVVNAVGLPTGPQQITMYTIPQLEAINSELRELSCELSRIRSHWPL